MDDDGDERQTIMSMNNKWQWMGDEWQTMDGDGVE